MIDIDIAQELNGQLEISPVEEAARATLSYLSISAAPSLSILVTTDQQIQELNQKYRGINLPTDVLAFPAGHLNPEDGSTYLGDVIISLPRAAHQAAQRGHNTTQEIQLLVIHGILHLFEFDHADPQGKQQMWTAKIHILNQLQIESQILGDR